MHFIVTGGSGFIGSHLVEQLLLDDHQVTVVDNLTTGISTNLPQHSKIHWLKKDILLCQPEDFPSQIDGIAHLAATPSVTASWHQPLASHHNNLSATVAVVQLCQALAVPRLVFASSAAVYGNPVQLPITEAHPTLPISPYGLQKLASEQYIRLFAQEFGFSAVNLRLFNVFGARQLPSSQYSGVISIFRQAMEQGAPININGDGSQTRDFVSVKDVVMAFAKALTTPLASKTCITCNIGTGQSISLIQLVEIFKSCFPGWQAKTYFKPPRVGDIQDSVADVSTAVQVLGFQPQWSLEAILRAETEINRLRLVVDLKAAQTDAVL